jgi:hypothetical protein
MKNKTNLESFKGHAPNDLIIKTSVDICLFLLDIHSNLRKTGAIDYFDYKNAKKHVRHCGKIIINSYDIVTSNRLLKVMNKLSIKLTKGIESCFKSIGTEIYIPPRLIKKEPRLLSI